MNRKIYEAYAKIERNFDAQLYKDLTDFLDDLKENYVIVPKERLKQLVEFKKEKPSKKTLPEVDEYVMRLLLSARLIMCEEVPEEFVNELKERLLGALIDKLEGNGYDE